MKTAFTTNLKDNVAAATLMAATLITIIGGLTTSFNAHAVKVVPQAEVQIMETILVTAPRLQQVVRMDTMVVTASRHADAIPTFMVA
jgi:hypothetical protein